VRTTRFWNNFHRVRSKSKDRKFSKIIKSFGSNKTKGPKQDPQNQLKSPMSEEGEP